VVLNEHFRCAPEIIEFSNRQFYDSRLVPLRLPGKSERLSPSIVDVKVRNGVKVGKVNEKEADEIVRLVKDFISDPSANTTPRSIGVIGKCPYLDMQICAHLEMYINITNRFSVCVCVPKPWWVMTSLV
jgi:hypothetical protein